MAYGARPMIGPADKIKPPKKANVERQAYAPDVIEQVRMAAPSLAEQIAVQLCGLLGRGRTNCGY